MKDVSLLAGFARANSVYNSLLRGIPDVKSRSTEAVAGLLTLASFLPWPARDARGLQMSIVRDSPLEGGGVLLSLFEVYWAGEFGRSRHPQPVQRGEVPGMFPGICNKDRVVQIHSRNQDPYTWSQRRTTREGSFRDY